MPTVVKDDAGKVLQDYLEEHGVKQNWLASKLGMTPSQLGDRIHGRIRFNADFAIQVASVLGISADIFLKDNYALRVK